MKFVPKISASLMCADLLNLERSISELECSGVDLMHIDIMDSLFVPNLTFGPDFVNRIKKCARVPVDLHFLMKYPRVILRSINFGKDDIVTIHSECDENIIENAAFVKKRGARFGLALNPETSIEEVKRFLPYIDVVLLMLIVPGFAGSTMIHGIMEKVAITRRYLDSSGYDNIEISVDGSVSCEKAKYMRTLGASIFVGGTAGLFKTSMSLYETTQLLRDSINIGK